MARLATGTFINLGNVYFKKPTIDLECQYEIPGADPTLRYEYSLSVEAPTFGSVLTQTPVRIHSERLQVISGDDTPVVLLKNEGGNVWLLDEERPVEGESGGEDSYIQVPTSVDRTALSQTYGIKHARLNIFQLCLRTWRYYDFDAPRLRTTEFKPFESVLSPDGSNLVSVLHALKNTDGLRYRRLLEIARIIEPKLVELNFIPPHQPTTMWVEDEKGEKFDIQSMSNGTLRFLSLCYIILTGATGFQHLRLPPPLTIIEEPENGIYVRHLKKLFEVIDIAGEGGQYIFTSHSPYFIDLFDAHLENVVVMK